MMKTILFLLAFSFMVSTCYADWYIVNQDNQVIVKCQYEPDKKDLETRKEKAVFSKEDFTLGAVDYRNDKLSAHVKTAKELADEQAKIDKEAEDRAVHTYMDKKAMEEMKAQGTVFKHIDK